ncbi:hypothetical protein K432DRAFT_314620 [Lepidopterella palustris CBS 459.81]|uniref:Amidohydrolase-related domain-containing protein n=1 Tax=Lepidopterella palustris CBS 459.81 TaxID=1314670 RepID=A0A8E2DWD2_9PEZI|nr:hypothetical protein K432DRAFT_314620 [Lepidopterella palustris CBS 459.81]
MPPQPGPYSILDSHIHLWPASAANPASHAWMVPSPSGSSHPLASRHSIAEYISATTSTTSTNTSTTSTFSPPATPRPPAFIYVETDRRLPSLLPAITAPWKSGDEETNKKAEEEELARWAAEPLEELRFLRRIVEGTPSPFPSSSGNGDCGDDGFAPGDGDRMLGIIPLAPLPLPRPLFALYLRLAERTAGPATWGRVVGFRYLLQGIQSESEMRALVLGEDWMKNLLSLRRGRGGRGWCFDVGVDVNGVGVWQLEVLGEMVRHVRAREQEEGEGEGEEGGGVKFVLNHLCKPPLSPRLFTIPPATTSSTFSRYCAAISHLASDPNTSVKLSGLFSEFGDEVPWPLGKVWEHSRPWLGHVWKVFGPERVMFGSDWPVCEVKGPKGSWGAWREFVQEWLEWSGVGENGMREVWGGTARRVYDVGEWESVGGRWS